MTRSRLLSIAVVVLLLLNMATLGMLFFRKPPHDGHARHAGPKAIIIERLKFDAGQVASYEELIRDHRGKIGELDRRMMELRARLYDVSDPRSADPIIHLIEETQGGIERVHTDHFARIRALCRPDQLPLFDGMTKDLAGYFRSGPPPPKP
jgi:periplasmic protein CpxP/Spy